ncbi:MAG: NAD(P)/FAD-dependent oxidoreductase [Fimbriimonadaceae bacterium]|nr:NAD(P)/FAD-dependent oxidoreductase [Fimbriimonadaceae bacterium]
MNRVDLTVIGGGPVGLFAAFYAGLRGMSVRILDSLPELGGQLTALYPEKYVFDMPGFPKVLAKDLARQMIEQGTQFGPEVVLDDTCTTLTQDDEGWTIGTRSGGEYPTRTLVIAAGVGAFQPTKIGIEGEEQWLGRGLSYGVRDKSALQGKRVAIVGGGDSAFDWVLNLMDTASEIMLIHRRDQFRAHEDSIEKVLASGIPMKLWCEVKAIHGADRIERITIQNSQTKEFEELPMDAVVVNIGFKSSLGPMLQWGLDIQKNQIVTDALYRTNLPGVFAVGDVCTFDGKLKLIATGVGEAATAVCLAKQLVDPNAKLFPGHSSDMNL